MLIIFKKRSSQIQKPIISWIILSVIWIYQWKSIRCLMMWPNNFLCIGMHLFVREKHRNVWTRKNFWHYRHQVAKHWTTCNVLLDITVSICIIYYNILYVIERCNTTFLNSSLVSWDFGMFTENNLCDRYMKNIVRSLNVLHYKIKFCTKIHLVA